MSIRFASFNASLNRSNAGELITNLSTPDDTQAQSVAEIIQRTNPDVLLMNEFDFDEAGEAAALFQENYLSVAQNGVDPVAYPYVYVAPSNTGVPSDLDLNNDGRVGGPDDAYGFGFFPGQFGFAIFSKYPIVEDQIRTFQEFLWADMPGALLPEDPADADGNGDTANWYTEDELAAVRLSSKNHVDLPIEVDGEMIHVLASHPTPPVFDGPEDRNGRRNFDEIRFWSDYVKGAEYIYDDNGIFGGLESDARFVIMGDQNSDPFDGDSIPGAAQQILENPRVNVSVTPSSEGGPDAAERQGGANADHIGNPAFDTADFGFNANDPTSDNPPGNLRVDYVLPSNNLSIQDAQVFWQASDDPLFPLAEFPTSDHRLVYVDVVPTSGIGTGRLTVAAVEFLGEVTFPTGLEFEGTEVGGLSGLAYDADAGVYYALADDRTAARFYTFTLDLSDGRLDDGDIKFTGVTPLLGADGEPFPAGSIDPEGIALSPTGTLYISSEGDANALIAPFVNEFSLDGQQLSELPVSDKFRPTADQASGIRNNLAFESLTISPDGQYLYTATENALYQDGPAATLEDGSLSRLVKYDLASGEVVKEWVYEVDAVPEAPMPADGFSTNGLVELLALDDNGSFLALERAFSVGEGNTVKLYEVRSQGALDVEDVFDLFREEPLDDDGDIIAPAPFEIDPAVTKREILDIEADLGITPDNLEALAFGPTLPDGRQSLLIASDNNFSDTQFTQFLALALETDRIPAVPAVLETPLTVDDEAGETPLLGDSDDPAIWINAENPDESRVLVTLKDGGAAVFNLQGEIQQTILPADFGDIRYNNVDLLYGVRVPAFSPTGFFETDIAVFSDRENDSLAIYSINPETGTLSDLTLPIAGGINDPEFSIFGVDDGEATAYGLATYRSPATGKLYAFVTQADGHKVAQVELLPNVSGGGEEFLAGAPAVADVSYIEARVVRILELPVPTGDVTDSQSEGLVVDQELGVLYVALENEVGILKFDAEPDGSNEGELVQAIDADFLEPDLEGLTIYYGDEGTGYLIASSQGNNSFAVFTREGDNEYLGSFTVGDTGAIDQVNESDGLDVTNVALGSAFPNGLLVVQDGANDPQNPVEDDEELENNSTNFKFVDWADVANAFAAALDIDTTGYDPRNPETPSNKDTLPNGVASGDVTQDAVVLWTRSTVVGDVTFEYSTEANFVTVAGTAIATVTDGDIPVKVEIEGLDAGMDYYYRVTDAAGTSKVGQFATAAALGDQAGLRFGVSGDWRGELAPYPAISNADDQDLAFFVEHGDTIYADYASPAVPQPQAETLAEYRLKHAEVYGDRFDINTWADLRAATAVYATIDDHEVINDFSGGDRIANDPRLLEAFPGDDPNALVNDSTLFEHGLQAFQEYNPIWDEFYGETGSDRTANERKLYRANTFGADAATFILDTRSFRDAPLAAPDTTNPADVGRFLTESLMLDRQFLGAPQLEDLKADLLTAEANGITWKFVMVPEPIQELGIYNVDAFEGYAHERNEILKFVEANDIDNVVFVAADIHGTFVNNLTYTETVGGPRIATDVWEITTGSVAFDQPFGQTVIEVATAAGLLTPEQVAFYESLPIAPDLDDLPNDKDDFLAQAFQTLAIGPGGYDPIGLDDNLTAEQGAIGTFDVEATLLQGDYVAAHTYGWTQFDIDPETQALTVTTYGIEPYSEAELLADPQGIGSREPAIVSQFAVQPTFDEPAPVAELVDLTGFDGDVQVDVTVSREAAFDNVLMFYETDAQGRVDGLQPGDEGYEAAAAANLVEGLELFIGNLTETTLDLTLPGGRFYAPALLINGQIDDLATIADAVLGDIRVKRDDNVWSFEELDRRRLQRPGRDDQRP
jgi:myo-inositol-hexaphosphate 3-phosphohydrolase/phosphodiesterase/alkaline phosphatase D-like protein